MQIRDFFSQSKTLNRTKSTKNEECVEYMVHFHFGGPPHHICTRDALRFLFLFCSAVTGSFKAVAQTR